MNLDGQFLAINPEAFQGGFSEAGLLAYLARDVLKNSGGSGSSAAASRVGPDALRSSLGKVHALLGTLDRCGAGEGAGDEGVGGARQLTLSTRMCAAPDTRLLLPPPPQLPPTFPHTHARQGKGEGEGGGWRGEKRAVREDEQQRGTPKTSHLSLFSLRPVEPGRMDGQANTRPGGWGRRQRAWMLCACANLLIIPPQMVLPSK
jgi:hypothetical protein